jgi:transposase InsO family protein
VASARVSFVLDLEEPTSSRASGCVTRRSRPDSRDVHREPPVGRPSDSRRAPEVGDRRKSIDRGQVHATASASTVTDLAYVSDQSCEPDHGRRLLRRTISHVPATVVLIILAHDRRRIIHVAVTEHPTAAWTAQQLRNAFSEHDAPRYLLHDRDSVFADVATTIAGMNTQTVRTAPRSPWQNAYAERVIGSIRRECLDHVVVVNAAGLHRLLTAYVAYYMESRTHLALAKDPPISRPVMPAAVGRIVVTPHVGGLHHRYDRAAA